MGATSATTPSERGDADKGLEGSYSNDQSHHGMCHPAKGAAHLDAGHHHLSKLVCQAPEGDTLQKAGGGQP